uniref:Uncharacterized protein n=1 Tax=Rhizophora mucronata TaxID=61149 RepID=A0A2P2P198_RHIMU
MGIRLMFLLIMSCLYIIVKIVS